MPAMSFADAVCDRLNDLEAFHVVVNERQTFDLSPNGHRINVEPEVCVVMAATANAGLFLRRVKDGQGIAFQWHAIGCLQIIEI